MSKINFILSKVNLLAIVLTLVLGSCTDSNIVFIPNQEIQSLDDLVNYGEFRNKVLYINYWEVKSDPSTLELAYYNELQAKYCDENIEFIFLTTKTDDLEKNIIWKNTVNKHNLQGYHIQNNNLVYEIMKKRQVKNDTFPIFLIVNKHGVLKNSNAAKPSENEILDRQLEEFL